MAMVVHVRRSRDYDCTNGGLSKTSNRLLVFSTDDEADAHMKIAKGQILSRLGAFF